MPTIKDVAKLSQTSVGTVSRYLNGYHLKAANQARIEKAIKELNFNINPIARGLKTNKTKTVGVLVPELSNTFSAHVIEGMEQVFDEHGYSLLVCNSRNNPNVESEKLRLLRDKLVDGIILMSVQDLGGHIREIQENGLPIVLIDRLITDLSCDGVVSDNVNGAYRAVEVIINRGHKRIGIIAGPQEIYTAKERLEGYLRALKDYNIPVDESLICEGHYTQAGGAQALDFLWERPEPPTAVFVCNNDMVVGAVKCISSKELTIGKDISLFGYDQLEFSQIVKPPLSLVIQPIEEIGRRAAEMLVRRLEGDFSGFPVVQRLKTEMVVTDSVQTVT
ncbi:HTH-type transcriptional repressor CytR [Peptococcaceae bacterium CEB3]|nr:HTH-type transcriptional repressor CytR [Peptococcaceae bacterium CEB3]